MAGSDLNFIEVGGAAVEGSPEVLRTPVPALGPVLPPALAAAATPAEPSAPVVDFESVAYSTVPVEPKRRFAPELIAFHDPAHTVSRQYHKLLDNLLPRVCGGAGGVALLCGAAEACGTTTAALNLAFTLAGRGKRVVVVDACAAKPAVAARLGIPPVPGLSEICNGEVGLARAVRASGQPNLAVLTAGEQGVRPALALRSVPGILVQLRRRFEYAFVDGPTWHDGPEMMGLASACDALFLVAPTERYESAEFKSLLERLPRQGIRLGGCVLTHKPG
jgi:Mrp family chromosome partitioning ATPase